MRKAVILIFLSNALGLCAQQTTNYIQYLFNKGVINPAASGTSPNQKTYYCFGATRQWYDLPNSPKQTFVNFSYTIRAPRSYSYWQNVGATVERDQSGILSNNSYYLNYTIHLALSHNLVASVGVHAGFRKFFLSQGIIDARDPVNATAFSHAYSYPDIIPGFRLANKKFFFDVAARQVSVLKQADYFSSNSIAGGSRLGPSLFMAYGRSVGVSDHWLALPSIAVNWNVLSVTPAFNPTIMFFYDGRFGFGAATRNLTFAAAIFQCRILKNLSLGMSYAYSTNRARIAAPNTYEIMAGITPMGMGDKSKGKRSVAKCPALDF